MNEIRRPDVEEVARAREIVARHTLPDFITGFDVRLGFMDGDPALFVIYHEIPNRSEPRIDEELRRSEAIAELDAVVNQELLDAFANRLPFSLTERKRTV